MFVQKELCTTAAHTQASLEELKDRCTSLMLTYTLFSLVQEGSLVASTCVLFELLFQVVTGNYQIQVVCYNDVPVLSKTYMTMCKMSLKQRDIVKKLCRFTIASG